MCSRRAQSRKSSLISWPHLTSCSPLAARNSRCAYIRLSNYILITGSRLLLITFLSPPKSSAPVNRFAISLVSQLVNRFRRAGRLEEHRISRHPNRPGSCLWVNSGTFYTNFLIVFINTCHIFEPKNPISDRRALMAKVGSHCEAQIVREFLLIALLMVLGLRRSHSSNVDDKAPRKWQV